MLNSEFRGIAGDDTDYYPPALRAEIDKINDVVYRTVNNGVYRCGFARSQAAYEEAYDALFATFDELEARLGRQRYLVGGRITEADWRLFRRCCASMFRISRCSSATRSASPTIRTCRTTCATSTSSPALPQTVIPRHYVIGYWSIRKLNPTGIIPKGTPMDLSAPHDRSRLAA